MKGLKLISNMIEILTSIHLYNLDKQTNVRRTVGYHMPCRSAGDCGMFVATEPTLLSENIRETYSSLVHIFFSQQN